MRIAFAYALLAALVSVLFAAGILLGGFRAIERSDYMTYQVGARIVLDGHGDCLYDATCQAAEQRELIGEEQSFAGGPLPYNSPPWLAVVLLPLAFLSLPVAFWLFTLGSLALLANATWRLAWGGPFTRLVVTVLLLTAWPTVMGAIRGQLSIAVVALLGLSVMGSGAALGLSTLKPTLGPLWAAWLLLERRWRELFMAAAVTVGLVLLGVLVVGPRAVLDYPAHLAGVAAPDALGVHPEEMVNWRGVATRLGSGGWVMAVGTGLTLGMVAVTWMRARSRELAAAAAFLATPLVIPHANQHEAILATLGVVLLLGAAPQHRLALGMAALGTHLVLWSGPVLTAVSGEASAWMLFAAIAGWLVITAVIAVRTRSGIAGAPLPT